MKNARGREMKCQEASILSKEYYIPCGAPATMIVDNGDKQPYWMCEPCGTHNVRNRGGVKLKPVPKKR